MHMASYNFQLVMSLPAMSLGLRFCSSRKSESGGGGHVSTLGLGNMAASGLSCRKPLISPGLAISLLLCMKGLRKQYSGCRASISGSEAIFSLCTGDHWPRHMTIASSLDSGCVLSFECVQDGCNGTCVKSKASKPT